MGWGRAEADWLRSSHAYDVGYHQTLQLASRLRVLHLPPADGVMSDDPVLRDVAEKVRKQQEEADAEAANAKLHYLFAGLLQPSDVAKQPDPQHLIKDVLGVGTLDLLIGKPGTGKTLVALDMGFSVATGTWWQRRRKVEPGPVLYIYAEGRTGLKGRMQAWEEYHRTSLEGFPINFYPRPVDLLDPGWALAVAVLAEQLDVILVVIDTVSRNSPGGDEGARDMGRVISAADGIRAVQPEATVLLVHHTPKEGESSRGHSSLEGAADTILLTKKDGPVITLSCQKQKDAEPFDPVRLFLQPVRDSAIVRLSHGGVGQEATETASEETLLGTAWDSFSETGASTAALHDACASYPARRSIGP